jgi:hypothetical protein
MMPVTTSELTKDEVQTVPGKVDLNAAAAYLTLHVGAISTLAPDYGIGILPTATIEADAPLKVRGLPIGRGYARVELSSSPGEAVDPYDPKTFRSANLDLGWYYVLGESKGIYTAVAGEYGFGSRFAEDGAKAVDRLTRHYGGGLRVGTTDGESYGSILYGRREECGPRGWGQLMVRGQIAMPSTDGSVLLVIDAALNSGITPDPDESKSIPKKSVDVLRVGIVADLAALAKRL